MTGIEIGGALVGGLFVIDKVAFYFRSIVKNGNENSQKQQVNIGSNGRASSECSKHTELAVSVAEIKIDIRSMKEKQEQMFMKLEPAVNGYMNLSDRVRKIEAR